jgi:hypothetical protein
MRKDHRKAVFMEISEYKIENMDSISRAEQNKDFDEDEHIILKERKLSNIYAD